MPSANPRLKDVAGVGYGFLFEEDKKNFRCQTERLDKLEGYNHTEGGTHKRDYHWVVETLHATSLRISYRCKCINYRFKEDYPI